MRRRPPRSSRVLLVVSILVAAATTLLLRGHLATVEARAARAGPTAPVVVAAAALERGTVLTSDLLRVERMPEAAVPPAALNSPAPAVGRVLDADVLAGEVITAVRLAPAGGPVAALVPSGLRAVPVTAPLPPGTVVAGDRVDVLATFATGQSRTETVVRAAEILDVLGGAAGESPDEAATVILLVGPQTAERMAFARAFADLSLAIAPADEGLP